MNSQNEHVLKDDFSQKEFPQVQGTIDNNKDELQNQHNKKSQRHLIILQICCYSSITLLRSKCSETKYDNHEVEKVAEELVRVDIRRDTR